MVYFLQLKLNEHGVGFIKLSPAALLEATKVAESLKVSGSEDEVIVVGVGFAAQSKTDRQRNTFHALVGCFWTSGVSSYQNYDELRDDYLIRCGHIKKVIMRFVVDGKIISIVNGELPDGIDPAAVEVEYVPLSFSLITLKKCSIAIDMIIKDMFMAGVDTSKETNKFNEILDGMNYTN